MYITAQRVRTTLHEEAINAYLYAHGGGVVWQVPPQPEQEPGELVNTLITVNTVGGNQVRSFLDIVAPDELWWSELRPRFIAFVGAMRLTPFPWHGVVNGCLFRLGMARELARTWQQEVAHLYRACEVVHHPG
jgi:hypothetical protein